MIEISIAYNTFEDDETIFEFFRTMKINTIIKSLTARMLKPKGVKVDNIEKLVMIV